MKAGRPASIRLFAALFFAAAICAYIDGMRNLAQQTAYFESWLPQWHFSRDAVIVILSARLTIALIPIALIWFLRAGFARWFVALITLASLVNLQEALGLHGAPSPLWLVSFVMKPIAVALLFTPSAQSWFARGRGLDARS
ncbi:hypothetical protein SZ64_14085 [Erythrobacter sp. SG61-1L]|uniref:hypothetical protein n=1 Tax=Erythrobacter sp. SG61-1L TaxID=1603897 RepID=UPI0006C8EB55|nr:hypothetical protein [Erythrobacter sp. SG61-1L]KPL69137.1 hypothetical protein SZ64_14085 [Erythrobacter sp. SG61-1L]